MGNLIGIFVFAILCTAGRAAYLSEKKLWNNGICAKYNKPWEYIDMDSQGGRGYSCGDQTIWISWPVDNTASE